MRQRRTLAVIAAMAALSACGSTAAQNGQEAVAIGPASGTAPQGLGAAPGSGLGPATTGSGGAGTTTGTQLAPGGGTGSGTGAAPGTLGSSGGFAGGTTGGASGGGTTSGGASAGGAQPVGPGVTPTTITIGIPYCTDCAAANAALGAGGEDPGDLREYYKAAIEDVNSRGGVLGRKLAALFHPVSASDNIDTSAQQACEDFTQDHKVNMLFNRGEISYECAKKAGIIVVGGGSSTAPVYARYPNLLDPATIRLDRLGAVTVKAMLAAGWQKPEPKWPTGKIGLVAWDAPDYHYAMDNGYLPALHAAGLKETDVRYIAVPQSDKSIADASAAVSSAVLAFKDAKIDHVFLVDGPAGIFRGTGLTFTFLNTAETQQYRPRYGFNSNNSPGWDQVPAAQQSGMFAVDGIDTEQANDEGITPNQQRERCFALMKKNGRKVGDTTTQNEALNACDVVWFAEALLNRAGGTSLDTMIAGGEALGTSFRSPFVYGTRLARGQHDGMALFRNSRFDDACACMKYTSKPYEP